MSDSLPPLFRAKKGAQEDMGRDGGGKTAFAKGEFEHEKSLGKQGGEGDSRSFDLPWRRRRRQGEEREEEEEEEARLPSFSFFRCCGPLSREKEGASPSSSYSFLPLLPFLLLPCCDFCLLPDTLRRKNYVVQQYEPCIGDSTVYSPVVSFRQ